MTERLHLSQEHRALIEALLREHLPGVEVWAYGSRVNGRGHDGSDLDLVLRGPGLKEIPAVELRDFQDAVRDSTIPFLVEARDWARLPERFRREIEREYVVLAEEGRQDRDGWREECWGDLVTLEYGRALRGYDMAQGPFRVFGTNGPIGWHDKALCEHASVVVGRKGAYRGVHYSANPFFVIDTAFYLKPKVEMDVRWAYYSLLTNDINGMDSGSAIPSTSREEFYGLPVSFPPLPEQRAIAHILGTLDDKIELNRRMNETLEAMARALFKSWFVDFDPVRAKVALRIDASDRAPGPITPPLRGSRGNKGVSPQASRWGDSNAAQPPRPWPEIRRQYTSKALHHSQSMRQNQTSAEGLLWYYLRNKQLGGYKFRRQQPIGPYIADFACLPKKLLIELDGGQHADPKAPDEQRDQFLRQQGYRVLRFWNHEVFTDCFSVLERVYEALTDPPPPQPAPDGLASATPPQGGSDWTIDRARAYLDGMGPDIAALFPDRFVDSELGEIPAGWEIGNLGHVAENPRRAVQPSDIDVGTRYIALEHMPKRCLGLSEWSSAIGVGSNKFAFRRGEFLFGKLRPYFHKVGIAPVSGVCSTDISVIAPMENIWSSFVLLCISSDKFVAYTDQTSTGTKMPRTSWNIMRQFELCLPTRSVTSLFQEIAQPMLDRIEANCHKSRALVALREALLPKLISGNLRLRELVGGKSCGPEC